MIKIGKDIHIYIMKDGKRLTDNLYDGRNSEWFNNMAGCGCDNEYDYLPMEYGMYKGADEEFKKLENEKGYFDFRYIKISDFKEWYRQYRPYLKAGFVSIYDKWRIENKGYIPEYASRFPSETEVVFVEYEDHYEPSTIIFKQLTSSAFEDAYLCWCFDW